MLTEKLKLLFRYSYEHCPPQSFCTINFLQLLKQEKEWLELHRNYNQLQPNLEHW